jgi:hypothetical protein
MKIFYDGSNMWASQYHCASSPVVVGDWVYFQAPDAYLWRMKTDGSSAHVVGIDSMTSSRPFVISDENNISVFFRGTNDALWRLLVNV